MTQRDPSQGRAPGDDEAVDRQRQARDLHRVEASGGDDFPAGYRTAGLDTSTRPDPGAPAVSTAQRGATGRKTSTGPARAVRQKRRTWANRLLGLLGIAIFLGIWELLPLVGIVDARFMPPASAAVGDLVTKFGDAVFWVAVWEYHAGLGDWYGDRCCGGGTAWFYYWLVEFLAEGDELDY